MKTQAQLFTRALTKVGAVGSGETASSEDVAIAQIVIGPLLDELAALQVLYIPIGSDTSVEEIPNEYFEGLATLLAADIGPDFGMAVVGDAARQDLMKPLRRIAAQRPTYETLQATYF